jgi:hypothetical protein
MKSRPDIAVVIAIACASETTGIKTVDIPPHTHQESKAPQGPNMYDLGFPRNGARTDTIVLTTYAIRRM